MHNLAIRYAETAEKVIALYEKWEEPEKVAECRAKLTELQAETNEEADKPSGSTGEPKTAAEKDDDAEDSETHE